MSSSRDQISLTGTPADLAISAACSEASSVARWRHWVHFDLSGGATIERHAEERGLIGKEIGVEKLVWGSDCRDDEIEDHVRSLTAIMERIGLTSDERDRIWYANAAEMFGEVTPAVSAK